MNNENNKFTIKNEMGEEIECEVLFTFDSEETKLSYICYTDKDFLVIKLEALGNVKINDVYAELNLNQIFIKGIKERDNDTYMTKNINDVNSSNYNQSYTEGIKLVKETRKYGKFNLIIPYGNEIKLAGEMPVEEENKEGEKLEEGIKIFKFPLAARRKK